MLPGNEVTITQHFDDVAATLRVGADVQLKPFIPKSSGVAVEGRLATASSSTKTWAIPWLLVVLVLVLVAIIVYMRRRRASAAPGRPTGPTGVGPGAPDGSGVAPAEPVGAVTARSGSGGAPIR
jgi:hypothetical protein